jgi:hypothetical protein
MRRHAGIGGGQEQGRFVAAGGLAHHQAVRRQAPGEGEKSVGGVGDLAGAAGGGVKHGDAALADIAADDAGRDPGIWGHGCGILDGAWDCLRASTGHQQSPVNSASDSESGRATQMTTGVKHDRETVDPPAP